MKTFVDGEVLTASDLNGNFVEAATTDTGWVAVPAAVGFSQQLFVRRIGSVVHTRGSIKMSSGNIATTNLQTCATVPSQFRPVAQVEAASCAPVSTSSSPHAFVFIGVDGTVSAASTSQPVNRISFDNITWTVN